MPYKNIKDLPDNIQHVLPMHAQKIYKEAFNNAYINYEDEITAIKVAWSAVKKSYSKNKNGNWTKIK